MKAKNFQDDNPSIPVDYFKVHDVLVFHLSSLEDCTKKFHYPELVGEQPRPELNLSFPLEHITELFVLAERMALVAVDMFGVVGKNI